MDIYTKRGDHGNTNLIGGKTVQKDHPRIEAYGTLDELNSIIGEAVSLAKGVILLDEVAEELLLIQHFIFDVGSHLADEKGKLEERLSETHIDWLEKRIDFYSDNTAPVDHFVLPGGHRVAASIHVARTVTRRAEREMAPLIIAEEIDRHIYVFVNRLSDYFFVLARYINQKMNIDEPLYERGGKVFHND